MGPSKSWTIVAIIWTTSASAAPPPPATMPVVERKGNIVVIRDTAETLHFDLADGRLDCDWANGATLCGATAAFVPADSDVQRVAAEYSTHSLTTNEEVHDAFGDGLHLVVTSDTPDAPSLRQHLWVYHARPEFYTQIDVVGSDAKPVATRAIAPLLIRPDATRHDGLSLGTGPAPRNLSVPYDNDGYSRYGLNEDDPHATSHEVGALLDDASRRGIVIGSVTHDLWKTAVQIRQLADGGRAGAVRVFGGAADESTHDMQPHSGQFHGVVHGAAVSSPKLFIGAFDDWRDGVEAFGRSNAIVRPALPWDGEVPFGWNSWAAHKSTLDANDARAATTMVDALREHGFANDGTAYVNLDSYWDNLDDATLTSLANAAHARGLRFGLYYAPFCYWGDDFAAAVPGADGKYCYGDIVLHAGEDPMPPLDGAWPLDPTHPGTRMRNDAMFARFARIGVDYVKLDFLTHGALEGTHFDPAIMTGTAAYNVGMRDVVDALSPRRMGRPVFISLSIAPLFPHGYGHSRRISCDAFGTIGSTAYLLNSAGLGWWTAGTLYRFNDPDHAVLYQTKGERVSSEAEARTRLNASIVAGGMLLDSDDATNVTAKARVTQLLESEPLLAVARSARPFRPIDASPGDGPTLAFVRRPEEPGGATLLAMFNVDERLEASREIPLERVALDPKRNYRVTDVRTGESVGRVVDGVFKLKLAPAASIIVRIEPR